MSGSDQPVGPDVDTTPARPPGPVVLAGRLGRVEKLDAGRHGAALWEAIGRHPRLWTYLFDGPFAEPDDFVGWLAERAELQDPYRFAVLDGGGNALGTVSLMSTRPEMRVIEVGNIVLGPALQRAALATEAHYLLARYVFEQLGYRRYEWKCDALNAPSRRAAARLGFVFEGVFHNHMIIKGRSRDTAWLAMLDSDWPARRAAFERWLDRANFDGDGRQKARLGACGDPRR